MDLGGGDVDVLIEENGNVTHPITLSLDENGGMGNSSVSPHSRDEDMQPSTQPSTQLTADDSSKDAEKLDAATAATETDTTATAGPDTTAADAAAEKMDEAAAKTDAAAEPKTTNGDAADKPAADSVTNTAKSGRTSASALPMLAPPHTAPPAPSKGSSAATSAKFPTSSTSPTVPHGSTEWEVERLVEQRESKGHIWFRVKWKEFNTNDLGGGEEPARLRAAHQRVQREGRTACHEPTTQTETETETGTGATRKGTTGRATRRRRRERKGVQKMGRFSRAADGAGRGRVRATQQQRRERGQRVAVLLLLLLAGRKGRHGRSSRGMMRRMKAQGRASSQLRMRMRRLRRRMATLTRRRSMRWRVSSLIWWTTME